jgi:ribose 5-phosphate isomerase A
MLCAMNFKEAAGEAALKYVRSGMAVGLGTGSTTDYFLIALGREVRAGRLTGIVGVPTSVRSEKRAIELGIALTTLTKNPVLDVAVDGADEVAPGLQLTKGLGGALLREKIVAQAARTFVVIADGGKIVDRLGTKAPLPVEVTPFEHEAHIGFFRSLGCEPALRMAADGKPYITDNQNLIYDLRFPAGIADANELETRLLQRAGVVDTGLFLRHAKVALIAKESGVEELVG